MFQLTPLNTKHNWMSLNLSELTPILFNMELTHLGSKAAISHSSMIFDVTFGKWRWSKPITHLASQIGINKTKN